MAQLITEEQLRTLKKVSLVCRAINHPLRLKMLRLIWDEGQTDVTNLYVKMRLEQSVASQHLAILRNAKLVNTRRDGKHIYYSVEIGKVNFYIEAFENLLSGVVASY